MGIKHKIPAFNAYSTYYAKIWMELADGGSDQWLWVARSGSTYVFIEILDLVAYQGREARDHWAASVDSVDIAAVSAEQLASAISSCGSEDEPPDLATEAGRLEAAMVLHSYGHKSPLWDDCAGEPPAEACDAKNEHDPAFRSLLKRARLFAASMLDDVRRDEVLDTRVVNKLGQTARQYAGGTESLWDTLRAIRDAGEAATPEQQLILKMYGRCEQTLGAGPVPEDLRQMVKP